MKKKQIKMNKDLKNKIVIILAIGISIILLFFVITSVWIGYEVKSKCKDAKIEYGGDCNSALISLLKDKNQSFRSRNSAVWALGQIGDSKTVPVLKSFYTGKISSKEPLDEVISQYELRKAINLTSGGKNITAIFWRYGLDN